MKLKILSLTISILIGISSIAQDTYQIFAVEGFKVKCNCKLKVNSTFIQMAKQQGQKGIIGAYICAENEDDPDSGVIININVYDESLSYNSIPATGYAQFNKNYLASYAKNLSSAGYNYNYTTYKGVDALEYTYNQMELPTKAIMFLKNKRSYLLQVATRKELITKYAALKSSFEIL